MTSPEEVYKWNTIKHIAIGAMLTVGGCVALVLHDATISGVCFGALAGYVIKNGVAKT